MTAENNVELCGVMCSRGPQDDDPILRGVHFACSVSLPVGMVSRVSSAPIDATHDVLLFVEPTAD